MAKAESKTILKAYSTVESKLSTLPLEDGQLIFVYDKKKIILDNHGVRTVYEQIQTIETEEQRNDLLAPIDSFYFVIETSILWRYTNGHWNQITTSPQEQIDRIVAEGTKQVKAVQDKGAEVLQSIPEDFTTQMETKLNKQQGIENKGKVLVIGEDGLVVPGEVQSGGDGIAIVNTMSGESPLVIPDSAERVNKRLELVGKTEQNQDPPPSPEYLQEIKNSGKWNEETRKYEIEISISGKNLFDFSTCKEGKVFEGSGNIISAANGLLTDFIPCFPNSQYSRSRTGSTVVAFYDCDKNKIGFEIVGNTTFVTPEKCRYFRFSALKTMVDYTKIVACPGQTVMDYEPYREPKFFTLTLNKPLRGIGEMKDELSESGILRRVKSITLNGSEKWYKYENSAFVAMNCYGLKIDDLEVRNYSLTTLCNFFKWARFPQDIESQTAHGGYIYFTVPKETYPDLESFKGWLAKNTPVLEYWLKEPALEELSEEDKASIRALKTYYPTTVITADGGELDPDIKVTYTADTKNYVDNKFGKTINVMQTKLLELESRV